MGHEYGPSPSNREQKKGGNHCIVGPLKIVNLDWAWSKYQKKKIKPKWLSYNMTWVKEQN